MDQGAHTVAKVHRRSTGDTLLRSVPFIGGHALPDQLLSLRGAPRAVLSPRGTGMIGWGLAAAIGARMGAPDDTVICVTGDGGF